MIKLKIDTLLFDLDGTLVDSVGLIKDTLKETFKVYFPKLSLSESDLLQTVGPSLQETFSHHTDDSSLIKRMIDTYREIYKRLEFHYIRIYPTVCETLQYFHEKKYHLAIVTTKFKESALPSIRHFGLDRWIDTVIGLDDVTNPKPHPESVFLALKQFSSQGAVIVGDSPSDLLAGKNAGILTAGVSYSYKQEQLRSTAPDFWCDQLSDLISMIEKYNEEE